MDDTKKMIGSIMSFLSLSGSSSGYRNSFKWRRLLGKATSSRGRQFRLRPGNGGSICAEIGDRVVGLSGEFQRTQLIALRQEAGRRGWPETGGLQSCEIRLWEGQGTTIAFFCKRG